MSPVNLFRDITYFKCLLQRECEGLLTAYYPEGIDILSSAWKNVEKQAQIIAEPVQLVYQSLTFGKIFQIFMPPNYRREKPLFEGKGHWSIAYSYETGTSGRIITEDELRREALLSGAPNEAPWYILDMAVGSDQTTAENRVAMLSNKTGQIVMAEFNGDILQPTQPLRPEERKISQQKLAEVLISFTGDGSTLTPFLQKLAL